MAPVGTRHAGCVRRLADVSHRGIGPRAIVSVRSPIELDEMSEPQPDVSLGVARIVG